MILLMLMVAVRVFVMVEVVSLCLLFLLSFYLRLFSLLFLMQVVLQFTRYCHSDQHASKPNHVHWQCKHRQLH